MTPTITKKWKWASTTPPDRWTKIAEEVISPSTAAADRTRRLMAGGGSHQREHRHQRPLLEAVGQAFAASHTEASKGGRVQP